MNKLKAIEPNLKPSPRMPVVFVGHGNPMNAILHNDITKTWSEMGRVIEGAQAVVVISAHWQTVGTHITDAPTQPIIYDMYGFPDELYQVRYEANGSESIANLLKQELTRYEAVLDSTWGLDHGTWSVLVHMLPNPQIPVLQISLDMTKDFEQVVAQFAELRHLRDRGVVFIGSGNIVHNLREVQWGAQAGLDWAIEFDTLSAGAIRHQKLDLLTRPEKLTSSARLAIPTDDHYRPMLATMGLLHPGEEISYYNEVIDLASVSMRSYVTV